MDGRGRFVGPLSRSDNRADPAGTAGPPARLFRVGAGRHQARQGAESRSRIDWFVQLWAGRLGHLKAPRWAGVAASALFVGAGIAYGVVKGDHVAMMVEALIDTRDAVANAAGFGIASVSLSGGHHVSRDQILAAAGVTERTSLLFLDVQAARNHLLGIPWIAEATVRKLYPDRLQITVSEREPFALWQHGGTVSVISIDGTVIAPLRDRIFAGLPLVVGQGAGVRAREFLALLDRHSALRETVSASILVAERRWNLRLKNGLDIKLPEANVEQALDRLEALDRDRQLLSRDISVVDLRLSDRVTVRLSEEAAQAREQARKDKSAKRRGSDT
jgi:cell division protein FtsQ